jgi:phage FluMu protein Com
MERENLMERELIVFKCNFCGKVFTRATAKFEVTCPKCKEIDVELIGTKKNEMSKIDN